MASSGKVVRQQEQELSRARQIQQDLLPKSIPQLRGIQVAAWQPASAVVVTTTTSSPSMSTTSPSVA